MLIGRFPRLFWRVSAYRNDAADANIPLDATDLMYGLHRLCRGFLNAGIGVALVGTQSSFTRLSREAEIFRSRCGLVEVSNVDTFTVETIKELVLTYFNIQTEWDQLITDESSDFYRNIKMLTGRGLWASRFVQDLEQELHTKVTPISTSLRHLAETTAAFKKQEVKRLVKNAFKDSNLIPNTDFQKIPVYKAMLGVYAMIKLDGMKLEMERSVLNSLVVGSAVCVRDNRALLDEDEEAMVKECVVDEATRLLNKSKMQTRRLYRLELYGMVTSMVRNNLLLQHGGLGESAEPLLALTMVLSHEEASGKSVSLWDLFKDFLRYVTKFSESSDPNLRQNAAAIIEDLQTTYVDFSTCKNLSWIKDISEMKMDDDENTGMFCDGHELRSMFSTFPPTELAHFNGNILLYLLSVFAGWDLLTLVKKDGNVQSMGIQSKIKNGGLISEAAMTTDPNLQYLTNAQRRCVLQGLPVSNLSPAWKKYNAMRQALGAWDPFANCRRFLLGAEFKPTSFQVAVEKYFTTPTPLLFLDLGSGLRQSMEDDDSSDPGTRLSMDAVKALKELLCDGPVKPMQHMLKSNIQWKGAPPVNVSKDLNDIVTKP